MTKIFYHAVILAKEVAKRDAYIAYMLILGKKRHVLRANTFQYEIDQFTGLGQIEINWLYRTAQKPTILIIPMLWRLKHAHSI
ncbi:MAG TPA: hypothetical protein VK909_02695 [Anaerolineales bacterium]|nr:hypothetical protein [Anaerolineales bacterium]